MIDLRSYVASLQKRAVVVYGLGRSGTAAAVALRAAGADVYVGDDDASTIWPLVENNGCHALTNIDHQLAKCSLLILNPGVPFNFPKPHKIVMAARAAGVDIIGDIELCARACPHIKTVGITGTNGKSTTTALITHILNHAGQKAIACGNIGNPILDVNIMDDTIMVIEMSSFQIDLCPTFHPHIAVHLNITPDHLDRHGTIENYIAIKEYIFNGPGLGFCGVDDTASKGMFDRAVGRGVRAMQPVSIHDAVPDGIDLDHLPTLRGDHNKQNALAAYYVTHALGVSTADIQRGLKSYPGLPHRQFLVRHIGHVSYINDSKATNADATEKALKTYRHIHWIVGGLPKTGGLSGLEPLAKHVDHAYLIGKAAKEFEMFMQAQKINYTYCETLENALAYAHNNAQNFGHKATVLLSPACASYDQFDSYEHRGTVFEQLVNALNDPHEAHVRAHR